MKQIYLFLIVLMGLLFASCEDYLTPELADQITMEEIFSKRPTTERFLAQVYSYLPQDYNALESTTPRSDEAYFSWTAWVGYLGHNDGSWNPTTNNFHTWTRYYEGINQATAFIDNVEQCLEISLTERSRMKAEARFLRAFFYAKLIEQYGPVYIWGDQAPDLTIVNEEIDRHSLDACIGFVAEQFDEAAAALPEQVTDPAWYGRVTKGAALAMKSRLLLYAARPLFNGCDLYKGMKNYYGDYLFPQTPDPDKWEKAAAAARAVIDLNVYSLYEATGISDAFRKGIESYMGIYFHKWNNELIFARWEGDSYHWGVRAAPPAVLREGYGGYAPSLKLVDTYPMASGRYPITGYQNDGTPIIDQLSGYSDDGFTNSYLHPIDGFEIKAHNSCVGRDARFYASVLFSGQYWINTFGGKKLVTFHQGGTSPFNNSTGDFVKVGYLFRRMNNPANDTEKGSWGNGYSWPYIRLAEIYLNYAEACNEKPDRDETNALQYLNKVRNRSGLNNIEVAYPEVRGNQTLLRELIRKERMVEMAFENLRYYDIRTWMIADKESNGPRYGRNLLATNYEDSWERTDQICLPIVFRPKHYLFPIHQDQLEEMKNMTQNYGW